MIYKNHDFIHVDTKILTPDDKVLVTASQHDISKHYAKPVRGYAIIEDSVGNVYTPNLVLLKGREVLTQMLAGIASPDINNNLLNYRVAYFGVGSGGADTSATPSKIGPFDNDVDLGARKQISDPNTVDPEFKYINNGNLKKIVSDGGSIEVVTENHSFTINNTTIDVEAYTTIKYTLIIRADEMKKGKGSFAFNEAGLYAVQFDPTTNTPAEKVSGAPISRYDPLHVCFARFTTMTKFIEPSDSFKITWYILL